MAYSSRRMRSHTVAIDAPEARKIIDQIGKWFKILNKNCTILDYTGNNR